MARPASHPSRHEPMLLAGPSPASAIRYSAWDHGRFSYPEGDIDTDAGERKAFVPRCGHPPGTKKVVAGTHEHRRAAHSAAVACVSPENPQTGRYRLCRP